MAALVWESFAFLLVATAGSAAFAAVRGLRAWRSLRAFQRLAGRGLTEVTRGVTQAEGRLARAGEDAARLERALHRLKESLRIASLLARSAGDARTALSWRSLLRQ